MVKFTVTKITAAQRQIDAAIRMLFASEDPVAVHTLAMAAFRILRDLASKRGDSYMAKLAKEHIRPGMEGKFWGDLQSFANFLKHADKDPDAIFDNVDEEVNDVALFMACLYYQDLEHQLTPEMMSLCSWFLAIHPEAIEGKLQQMLQQCGEVSKIDVLMARSRQQQLEIGRLFLQLAKKRFQT